MPPPHLAHLALLAAAALVAAVAVVALAQAAERDDNDESSTRPAKRVALLFDDGPNPATGEELVELFANEGVVANFALVGRKVNEHPEVARAYQAAGHEILNHSMTHVQPDTCDDAAMRREVIEGQRVLAETLDVAPAFYWTPFGKFDVRMPALWKEAGLREPPFNNTTFISTHDWDTNRSAADIREAALRATQDGTVILFHEWRQATLDVMPDIVHELKARGFTFVTVSEMEQAVGPAAPRD